MYPVLHEHYFVTSTYFSWLPVLHRMHEGCPEGDSAVYMLTQCTPLLVEKTGVAPDLTLRFTAHKQISVQARETPWLWNPCGGPHKVQNRGNHWPHKMDFGPKKLKKKLFLVDFSSGIKCPICWGFFWVFLQETVWFTQFLPYLQNPSSITLIMKKWSSHVIDAHSICSMTQSKQHMCTHCTFCFDFYFIWQLHTGMSSANFCFTKNK